MTIRKRVYLPLIIGILSLIAFRNYVPIVAANDEAAAVAQLDAYNKINAVHPVSVEIKDGVVVVSEK